MTTYKRFLVALVLAITPVLVVSLIGSFVFGFDGEAWLAFNLVFGLVCGWCGLEAAREIVG